MTTTEKLAHLVVSSGFKDVPKEAVEFTKELIIDFVGAAVAGSKTRAGEIITDYIKRDRGAPEASILGGGIRVPCTAAALANGTLAHATELENVGGQFGPNTTVATPAILSLSEKLGLSGKDVLEALIIGFEVQGRMHWAFPGVVARGWDAVSVFGIFGAAAASAKLLKLNVEQTTMTLSIAASGASGFLEQTGSMTHFLETGIAARQGLEAAQLAKMGFSAVEDIIEHPKGFAEDFAGKGGYDLEKLTENFGNPFCITGLSIKKYPCCFRTHRALDAVLGLMKEHNISYDRIASVEVDMNLYDASLLKYEDPKSGLQSRFSMEHALGMAILNGGVSVNSFTDSVAVSSKAKEVRSKVKVTVRSDWPPDRTAARTPVTVRLKDDRSFSREVQVPRQPTKEELLARHRDCCQAVLNPEQIERSTEMMLNLEKVENVVPLMDLLRG
jgi:2-methylcitrate dehydratase